MITNEKLIEIMEASGAAIEPENINMSRTFEEMGLDSLDVFNFFAELDAVLDVDVPDSDFEKIKTLSDVKAYLDER